MSDEEDRTRLLAERNDLDTRRVLAMAVLEGKTVMYRVLVEVKDGVLNFLPQTEGGMFAENYIPKNTAFSGVSFDSPQSEEGTG